jgi:fermentation-respiration switch protein FrsA (DUF1100 family)
MFSFIKTLLKKLGTILVMVYLALIGVGITYSDNLIFLPPIPSYPLTGDLISIYSKTASDESKKNRIMARYLLNPQARYTILYSHGNAVDIGQLHNLQQNFYNHGYSVIVYDYSGYGHSKGVATEQQVYNDVRAVYDYLLDKKDLNPEQIISYGHSLGAAIATDLAFKKPVAGLILENPFTTAFRVKTVYPLVPFDKFSSIDKISDIKTPLFITHSKDDAVIPFWHSQELYEKARQPKLSLWFENEGHTGISYTKSFWPALASFVSAL